MPQPRHVLAVAGFVGDGEGRVLLVRNYRGWEMPGGQVELGEDPLSALRREVKEESGCDVAVGELFGLYSNLSLGLLVLAFRCTYIGGTARGGEECLEAGWYDPSAALSLVTHFPAAQRLRDALAMRDDVVFRSYVRSETGAYEETDNALI